jgi:hypothetical protein
MRVSKFANYCHKHNIGVLLRGFTEDELCFDVYFPRELSERVRSSFEKKLRADNAKHVCDIAYL